MAEYYLISQLPSLDAIGESTPMPITEKQFLELCHNFLSKKALNEIENITLTPSMIREKSSSDLIEAWNEMERNLRLALGRARAEKMNKPLDLFDSRKIEASNELQKIVNASIEEKNPLEAERLLLQYRLSLLESLRPMDSFSREYVFYYALKLKLLSRVRQFNTELGEATYKNIYNSILNAERLEDK